MKLPNREQAFIQPAKLVGYLLSETHSVGKSKAKFFRDLGFNEANVLRLEQELLAIASSCTVADIIETAHGTKYVMIGTIDTPVSKSVSILTVWIIDNGQANPRFVTARPFVST